ncbi:MAG: hypothetical protein LBI68_06125, partial [Azoarcus sp.]|nr:hypothetical protein [Azoarcus sp.]
MDRQAGYFCSSFCIFIDIALNRSWPYYAPDAQILSTGGTVMAGNHYKDLDIISFYGKMEKASDWLIENVLPIGWLMLLTGMFWIGDRSYYHKLYYISLLTPSVLAIFLYPSRLRVLFSFRLITAFILFVSYAMLSILWSGTDESIISLIKRPFYVLFLLFSAGRLALKSPERLMRSLQLSAIIVSLIGLVSLGLYLCDGTSSRLTGYGALYNSLLSSHVYGYFMAF